jgi:hypothetical protein
MKTRTLLAIGAGTALLLGASAVALDAVAQGRCGGMMGGGPGMTGGVMMGPGGPGMRMFEMLDTNDDDTLAADEVQTALRDRLEAFDADGDGTLALEEFQDLHAEFMRPMMVDHFQFLDDDGDGQVTPDEMGQPFARMIRWMDTDGDGAIGPDELPGRRGGGRGPGMMGGDPGVMGGCMQGQGMMGRGMMGQGPQGPGMQGQGMGPGGGMRQQP